MTYGELSYKATKLYTKGKITICEYLEMTKPLNREIEQEPILDKIRAEIEQDAFKDVNGSKFISVNRVNQIIDKYRGEVDCHECKVEHDYYECEKYAESEDK